ncbi:MAG: GIY-YIG nuclease family protein [Desulfobacterales bacterium]
MAHFVYIIQSSADGTYYVGSTQDVDNRLKRHNQGRSQYTKPKRPWNLVYFEEYSNKSDAIKRENSIKRRKNKRFIESLIEAFSSA